MVINGNIQHRMVTTWQQLKNYLNEFSIGDRITRRNIFASISSRKPMTIDTYRTKLTKKEYLLKTEIRGTYILAKKIPVDLPTNALNDSLFEFITMGTINNQDIFIQNGNTDWNEYWLDRDKIKQWKKPEEFISESEMII